MKMKTASPDAYRLLHEGQQVLSRMEHNGIKIDLDYLDRTIKDTGERIRSMEADLKKGEEWRLWRRRFGERAKLGSREQLATVLFTEMKLPAPDFTAGSDESGKKRHRTDEEVLAKIDSDFVRGYLKVQKLAKLRSTYLQGIRREVVDGFVHPVFNLHLVVTFRSSSSDPNFQNIPIRNVELAAIIRQCYVARPGHRLLEIDFSGIEVRVAACYNHDPVLIKYIEDPTTDMHRDTAMDLFLLAQDQVEKRTTRDWAKNRFVFPEFYGSVYFQCAPSLWDGVLSGAKMPNSDITIREHLRKKGIKNLGACDPRTPPLPGTFEYQVKKVEDRFWNERFAAYTAWKKRWWQAYCKEGGFDTLTGFRIEGLFGRNDVLNYGIQGSAFHCLLWSLIRLQRWIDDNRMRAKIVGQIHDSTIVDCPDDEVQDVLNAARTIMTKRLPKAWPWLIVPLDTESEVTPVGGNWHQKRQWVDIDGTWREKSK